MDWNALYFSLLGSCIFLTSAFGIALYRNRYDIIDVAWGLAFIAITLISFTTHVPLSFWSVQTLVAICVIIWGLRLSIHIYKRWDTSKKEDKRYADYRKAYGDKPGGVKINMYFRIYIVQALLAVIVAVPVIVVNGHESASLSLVSLLGLFVWLIGFYFETVGDYQLKRFLNNPNNRGKLMTQGVWKYTRHPNYFGEMTQWWGIFIIALAVPDYWWVSIIGPIVITALLVFISGVPLTEKHFASKPGWAEYKKRTSKLFPLPPRS